MRRALILHHYCLPFLARKQDVWMVLNSNTGSKLHMFSTDGWSPSLVASDVDENPLYIGRTGEQGTFFIDALYFN